MIDLPDVDFQSVFARRSDALRDLVSVLLECHAAGEDITLVVGQPAPEHIGKHHIEPAASQFSCRAVPIAGIGPGPRMIPERPAFSRPAGSGAEVRFVQETAGLANPLDGLRIFLLPEAVFGQREQRLCRLESFRRIGVLAPFHIPRQVAGAGTVSDAFRRCHLALDHSLPKDGHKVADDGCQELLLSRAIVGQQDVAEEGTAVAQEHGGMPRGPALGVEPAADDLRVLAIGLGDRDVPGVLADRQRQAGDIGGREADLSELVRPRWAGVFGVPKAEQFPQTRRQLVADEHFATSPDEPFQRRDGLVRESRIVSENGHPAAFQHPLGCRVFIDGIGSEAEFLQHVGHGLGGIQGRSQLTAGRAHVRNHQGHIMPTGRQAPESKHRVLCRAAPYRQANAVDLPPAGRFPFGAEGSLGEPERLPSSALEARAGRIPSGPTTEIEAHLSDLRVWGGDLQCKLAGRREVKFHRAVERHPRQVRVRGKRGSQRNHLAARVFNDRYGRCIFGGDPGAHGGRGVRISKAIEHFFVAEGSQRQEHHEPRGMHG